MIKQLHKQYYQLHTLLTRLTLDVDVLVLFELPLSRSVFALVGLLTLDLKYYNYFGYHNCVFVRHVSYGKKAKRKCNQVLVMFQ